MTDIPNPGSEGQMTDIPNPGSDEAIEQGCTCPVEDNKHGEGIPSSIGPLFWMEKDCPVHGDEA